MSKTVPRHPRRINDLAGRLLISVSSLTWELNRVANIGNEEDNPFKRTGADGLCAARPLSDHDIERIVEGRRLADSMMDDDANALDFISNSLCYRCRFHQRMVRQNYGDFFSSIAVRLAFPSNDRCHDLGSRLKHLVADAMSVRVVEVHEMIEVDHDEAKR